MVLVDSSIYIHLLRSGDDPVETLTARYDATEIVSCNVVRCEVLRGMVRPRAKADLAQFFDLLIHVTMDHRAWQETEDLAWRLDRAGKILPLTDIIIAACARHAGATVVTLDRHFSMVPDLPLASWE